MISLVQLLKEAQGAPKAIILAGAPGAGKSSVTGEIISDLGLKVMNIDDFFIKNLRDAGISLDLKKADAEGRSGAAKAMAAAQKDYQEALAQEIGSKGNFVIDGTSAALACSFSVFGLVLVGLKGSIYLFIISCSSFLPNGFLSLVVATKF